MKNANGLRAYFCRSDASSCAVVSEYHMNGAQISQDYNVYQNNEVKRDDHNWNKIVKLTFP